MNIDNMLKQLRDLLPAENFKVQPDAARCEIIQLEKKYNINTYDFLKTPLELTNITDEDRDVWINTLDTFINFGGKTSEINHLASCNNKQFIREGSKADSTKEYARKKSKEPEDGFLALYYDLIISLICKPSLG